MENKTFYTALVCVFLAALFMTACEQIGEVNKLIGEANKKMTDASDLIDKANKQADEVLSSDFADLSELRTKSDAKVKDALANYDKATALLNGSAADYTTASKLKINDKLKGYIELKSKESAKLGETTDCLKTNLKAFVDASDPESLVKKLEDNKTKLDKLSAEAKALTDQVTKFETDNKDLFEKG